MLMIAHRVGGKLSWNNSYPAQPNIIRISKPRDDAHPNIKPVELVIHFVLRHTQAGATVLDPFMGSGTTGIACIRTGKRFIGIEKDLHYFQVACERIERELQQGTLLPPTLLDNTTETKQLELT